MAKAKQSPTEQTIHKLTTLAHQLRQGDHFPITRLTVIKRLCADSVASAHFALFIANRIFEQMLQQSVPPNLSSEQWTNYQQLVADVMPQIAQYVDDPTNSNREGIHALLYRLEQEQNQYKHNQWGAVRIIQSKELVTVETALRCLVAVHDTDYWCYQLARDYAERYDPRYGTGLIPQSAPFVEDIAAFWGHYDHANRLPSG